MSLRGTNVVDRIGQCSTYMQAARQTTAEHLRDSCWWLVHNTHLGFDIIPRCHAAVTATAAMGDEGSAW